MASKKSKPMFHKPQTTSKPVPIPTSTVMKIISLLDVVIIAALSAFSIYLVATKTGVAVTLSEGFTMNSKLLYLFFPILGWFVVVGFRLALRLIPLDMWRLPATVKAAAIKSKGKNLKFATLLIQLETVLIFCYITLSFYYGNGPQDLPIIIWVLVVAATIVLFGRKDVEEYRQN